MEAALGARLFARHSHGFSLTPAGDAILLAAGRVEEAVASLERTVAGDDTQLDGRVRITTTEAFAQRLLIPSLARFHMLHPGICIEVICDNRLLDLARGQADIAVRVGRSAQDDLVSTRIGESVFAMYASHDYLQSHPTPRTLHDIDGHALIGYEQSASYLAAARWLDNVAPQRSYVFRGNSTVMVAAAAAAGLGLAVLPCILGETDPALRRVAAPETVASQSMWLVAHAEVRTLARVRATVAYVTDALTAAAPLLRGEQSAHPRAGQEQNGAAGQA
jgi:DNA-binding transcriptional LysR family regulator